ncbi:hypothetical protein [Dyella caseinilytica]|uniref:Uncharacterized protein n=1 Tax=Dyella caseinilytica TaxID=1849581 RepID=A0ABX7H0E1_9GAMM|nr:hypothetical protein [Dyella caseinilytica]QRN55362.1 hypothetical protein ISN74_08585 [Dyella caseinilytica]GGA01180.1 hypothetical protein GCM10011408_22980 [Dyella caseinilytica]
MNKPAKRSSWGSPRAFAELGMALFVLTLIVNTHSPLVKSAMLALWLTATAVGSCIVLWRVWQHRGKPGSPPLGQTAALPPKWRKWVLGEVDDDKQDTNKR